MNQKKNKILVWSAGFLVTEGLKSLFSKEERFSVTETAGTYEQLMNAVGEDPPDVLIIDAAANGFEEADFGAVKSISNSPAVLLLLDSVTRNEFQNYSEAGIENIVLKNASGQEILNAADSAVNKKKYYSSGILDMILDSIESKQQDEMAEHLTPSEKEIVRLIAGGMTTKEIAARRNISFHTVNTHRKNIFRKLKVSNASELIMKAIKAGWIDNIEYYI